MIYDYTQVEKDAGWLATCPPDFVISGVVHLFELWRRKGDLTFPLSGQKHRHDRQIIPSEKIASQKIQLPAKKMSR